MRNLLKNNISVRVATFVFLASVSSAIIFSVFDYYSIHQKQLNLSQASIEQLIIVVNDTASIATYLDNEELANDVVNGLTKNDLVSAASISSKRGLNKSANKNDKRTEPLLNPLIFPLNSPFDSTEQVGELKIYPNTQYINEQTENTIKKQLFYLLSYTLIITLAVLVLLHYSLLKPIHKIALELIDIKPGGDTRVDIQSQHEKDEIGHLSNYINLLLETTKVTLLNEREQLERSEQLNKELVEAQEQLVNSEKMASLGQLVAGVAHEINTPVGNAVTTTSHLAEMTNNIILSFENRTARKEDMDTFFHKTSEVCQIINENLLRTSELVKSFKMVSADQTSQEQRHFNLKDYIENVVLSLKPKLKQTKHQVTILCEDNIELYSYPGALSQIVTNFIINSLTHAFVDETVGIMKIEMKKLENDISLLFSDNGKGISEQHIDKIFDPFFTTKRGEGNTGLGLHIIYNLITQTLKGTVTCKSKENEGTTFEIQLPISLPSKTH